METCGPRRPSHPPYQPYPRGRFSNVLYFIVFIYLMVPTDGGLSGADDDDDDDELVASMRATGHTRTECATLATHYSSRR